MGTLSGLVRMNGCSSVVPVLVPVNKEFKQILNLKKYKKNGIGKALFLRKTKKPPQAEMHFQREAAFRAHFSGVLIQIKVAKNLVNEPVALNFELFSGKIIWQLQFKHLHDFIFNFFLKIFGHFVQSSKFDSENISGPELGSEACRKRYAQIKKTVGIWCNTFAVSWSIGT